MADMATDVIGTAIAVHIVCAVPWGKHCSEPKTVTLSRILAMPPKKKHKPMLGSRLNGIEPRTIDRAKVKRSCFRARMPTTNSTALPEVALSISFGSAPKFIEIRSIASDKTALRGMMAKEFVAKTVTGLQLRLGAVMAKGTMARSQ